MNLLIECRITGQLNVTGFYSHRSCSYETQIAWSTWNLHSSFCLVIQHPCFLAQYHYYIWSWAGNLSISTLNTSGSSVLYKHTQGTTRGPLSGLSSTLWTSTKTTSTSFLICKNEFPYIVNCVCVPAVSVASGNSQLNIPSTFPSSFLPTLQPSLQRQACGGSASNEGMNVITLPSCGQHFLR